MDERRTDTREQIRVVALEMFAERGYAGTSLREIAERLGVTKAAVYYHFPTKEDILASLLEDFLAQLDELIAWTERAAALARTPGGRPWIATPRCWAAPKTDLARFMQEGQSAIRELAAGLQVRKHFAQFQALLAAPDESAEGRLRAQVALVALHLAAFGPLSPAAAPAAATAPPPARPHRAARRGPAGRATTCSRGPRCERGRAARRPAAAVGVGGGARPQRGAQPRGHAARARRRAPGGPRDHRRRRQLGRRHGRDRAAGAARREGDQPDPHRQGQRAGLRVRRRHRGHHRDVRRRRLRRSGRDPGVRRGARGGRRLRQGQPVHRGRRQRRHHAAAERGQRRAQPRREHALRHRSHRPVLRLQRLLGRHPPGARPPAARRARRRHALGRRLRDRDPPQLPGCGGRADGRRGAVGGAAADLRGDQPAHLRRRQRVLRTLLVERFGGRRRGKPSVLAPVAEL